MQGRNTYIHEGVLVIKNFKESSISRQALYDLVKKYSMEKIGPGIYITPETLEDEVYTLLLRCPKGIASHEDALYYYGLMDREPLMHTLTIYSGYNPTRLRNDGYRIYTVKKELLDLGKKIVTNQFGHKIPMYDLERTICDLVRSRSHFEIQDFNYALKSYAQRQDKNLYLLMKYAKAFRIENIIRNYMEVLL